MGVLIQRVSGLRFQQWFFPTLAGVAFSRNLYAWNTRIDPSKGLIRLVLGLCTSAVNRVGGGYPRLVAISQPLLRPEIGVKIALEDVGNNFIMSPEQAVEYLDAINSEWVGFYFDIGNAGRVGPAERWIQVIAKRIFRIHIKDYNAKPADPAAKGRAPVKLLDGDTNCVAKLPSATQLTRIRWGAHSTLTLFEAAICPAREAMVCGMPTLARVTGMTRLTITPGCPRAI